LVDADFLRVVFAEGAALPFARAPAVVFEDFFATVRDFFGAPFAPDRVPFNATTLFFTAERADCADAFVPEETRDLPFAERFPIMVPAMAPATAPTGPATTPPITAPATPPAVCFDTGSWGFAVCGERFFIPAYRDRVSSWL